MVVHLRQRAYTKTSVNVQYSAESEQVAVKTLLGKSGFLDSDVPNSERLRSITNLAGIVRVDLNNQEQLGERASMVNAHYDDFERVLEDLGNKRNVLGGGNRETVKKLAQLMDGAGRPPTEESAHALSLTQRVKKVMEIVQEAKITLTKDETFTLGIALDVCAGDKDDRHKWWDREKQSSEQILETRKITDEDVIALSSYHDELKTAPAAFEGAPFGTTREG